VETILKLRHVKSNHAKGRSLPLVIGSSCGTPIEVEMRPSPSPKKKKEQSMLFAGNDTSKRNSTYPAGFAVGSPGIPRNVIASDQVRIAWVNAAMISLYNSAQKSQVLKSYILFITG